MQKSFNECLEHLQELQTLGESERLLLMVRNNRERMSLSTPQRAMAVLFAHYRLGLPRKAEADLNWMFTQRRLTLTQLLSALAWEMPTDHVGRLPIVASGPDPRPRGGRRG